MSAFKLPPGVSAKYVWDWQFANRLVRMEFIRNAAFLLTLSPLAVGTAVGERVQEIVPTIGWLWACAATFTLALIIYHARCPALLKRYTAFGEFDAEKHSHRWVGWVFYHNVKLAPDWPKVVRETLEKNLAFKCSSSQYDGIVPTIMQNPANFENGVHIFKPVNIDRDLYIPMIVDGERAILPLRETDKEIAEKVKELFWVTFTPLARSRATARTAFWLLLHLAGSAFLVVLLTTAAAYFL